MKKRGTWLLAALLAGAAAAAVAAPVLPDHRIATAAGVQEIVVRSRILDQERTLLVRLPQGYADSDRTYPVVVMLDADWHFSTAAADVELLSECSYVSNHAVPPLILVGVANTDRNRDFTPSRCPEQLGMKFPTSGGAQEFRRFLVEEALPVVDAAYRTQPFRVLAGWSLGGLFAVETALGGSAAFDACLAISPSLWWDDQLVVKRLAAAGERLDPADPRQLVVTLGSVERDRGSSVATATGAFLAHLQDHPLPHLAVEEVVLEGMGHEYAPKLAYFYGLATVFADMTMPAGVLDGGLAAADAYYAALGRRYKSGVPVPESVYSRLGWQLFEAGRTEEAGDVFRRWAERHPGSVLAVASLGSFCRETGDPGRAADLFRRAIELEEASASPRQAFVNDLRRDIDGLQAKD